MDVSGVFLGKNITVLGLGLLGRAVGDIEFLLQCGANVTVTDKKSEQELVESVERLKKYKNVLLHLGGHRKEDFTLSVGGCDMVIKAAGVRLDSPEVAEAKKAGVPVYMSTALFTKYASEGGAVIVGVTGTRGKSTVAHMIYHSLIRANKKVVLGGNVRGVSTLAMLPKIKSGDIVVLELDSWQLQGFGDLKISPHIAVFTNMMQDHVNYYSSEKEYFSDKANIYTYQKPNDVLIVGKSVAGRIQTAVPYMELPSALPKDWKLNILGEHNRENAALAASALKALGIPNEKIRAGVESFGGVEGRLQFVREINGVKIYNDNNATTPEATIAALRSIAKKYGPTRSIFLIMGGADKGLDMDDLISEVKKSCKKVLLLRGTGTDTIQGAFPDSRACENLKEAVHVALELAHGGDSILFSPAFASFGMFKNEYDRNDQFMNIIQQV